MNLTKKNSNICNELNNMRFFRLFDIGLQTNVVSEHTWDGGVLFEEEINGYIFTTINWYNTIWKKW